jgi:hypothetical protein
MERNLNELIIDSNNILTAIADEEGSNDESKNEVPVNMVWQSKNEIVKDTGIENFANIGTGIIFSLYNYIKNDGTQHFIRNLGTILQKYNSVSGNFEDIRTGFTANKRFGYTEYDNNLYLGNGVENYFRYDGTTFTEYASFPKGNILTIFEDRVFIAGNPSNPSTIYYSNTGDPINFLAANIIKIPKTDKITGMIKYYDSLVVFKENSVWKITYIWNGSAWIPSVQTLSENYGCISPKAYCWVENDIWFFTGKEVRRIGYLSSGGEGILGFDPATLSEQIKETLKLCNQTYLSESCVFYNNKKFYLSVPYGPATNNNLTFVCHLLYNKTWTKLKDRTKSNINCMAIYSNNVYQASSAVEGIVYRWNISFNDLGTAINGYIALKAVENKDFVITQIYRYLTAEFKNIIGGCRIDIYFDDIEERKTKTKTFFVSTSSETEEDTLGETGIGELLIADAFGETVQEIEYLKRKFSFLDKAQSIKVKFSNNTIDEKFVLSKLGIYFKARDKKYISPNLIVNIS